MGHHHGAPYQLYVIRVALAAASCFGWASAAAIVPHDYTAPRTSRTSLLHRNSLKSRRDTNIGAYGFDEEGQDLSVRPGDDFFSFANGKYVANMKIPDDQSRWGSFDMLADQSLNKVKGILEADMAAGGKMGRFYSSFMNESALEMLDNKPIKSTLAEIAAVKDAKEFAILAGRSGRGFLSSPFGVGVSVDPKDVASYCVMVDQAGIGLPRDYFLKKTFAGKKAAYTKYAATMLEMVGWPKAQEASTNIVALEEKLANVSWSEAEQRDPIKNYNLMSSIDDLASRAPGFDWAAFMKESGDLPRSSKLVVGALGGVVAMAKVLGETDISVLRSYAAFHFVSGVAPILSKRFLDASFNFQKQLSGQTEISARWKRGVRTLNNHMGEAVGQEFVNKYFPASAKLQVEALTHELKKAFEGRLKKVSWMTEPTKQKALAKLAAFEIQVGYPKKFRDYAKLNVDATDLYGNIERSIALDWERDLDKLGKPVDRDEWAMSPQTVNAYNMPDMNEVVFPAAILQPPFFDPEADAAVNYGGIGGVIGHEMTHGFDDSGRHYNAKGLLEDWWTEADSKAFQQRADAYVKQFGQFDLGVPGAHIKPELTQGEDIADLGGLTLALDAYTASLEQKAPQGGSHKEGLRRVFLGWAQVWRSKQRPDSLLSQLASDPHPPALARVDIPCQNLASWYGAFDVQPGQKLYLPEDKRVVIW